MATKSCASCGKVTKHLYRVGRKGYCWECFYLMVENNNEDFV
jgi:transposase